MIGVAEMWILVYSFHAFAAGVIRISLRDTVKTPKFLIMNHSSLTNDADRRPWTSPITIDSLCSQRREGSYIDLRGRCAGGSHNPTATRNKSQRDGQHCS
ncbi:hypothetical protein BDW66DRAFT_7709 [Aspergillus desertorum]